MSFRIINGKIVPIDIPERSSNINKVNNSGNNFRSVLDSELNKVKEVKISAHAMERLKSRNIELNSTDLQKITEAIIKADTKGAKESLLLYKDMAFIASIRNKMIITAMDSANVKDNVFTNIDSAVLIS
jgi:flagellar operon protein